MATTKRRIPVPLAPDIEAVLSRFAQKNQMSLAQAISLFLRYGLENAEDEYFGTLADELDEKTTEYVSHDDFWHKVLD